MGQLPPTADDPTNCIPDSVFMQVGLDSGTSYQVPFDGVITQWRTAVGSGSAGTSAKLKAFRATPDPDGFLVAGRSPLQTMVASGSPGVQLVNSFPAQVSVSAGDTIAIRTGPSDGGPCFFETTAGTPANDRVRLAIGEADALDGSATTFALGEQTAERVNLQATLEGDSDGDGFGDGSQDKCTAVARPPAPGSRRGCPRADLVVKTRAKPKTVRAGLRATFVTRVRNAGPDAAPKVELFASFPASVSVESTSKACKGERKLRCGLGPLPPDSSRRLRVVVQTDEPGTAASGVTAFSKVLNEAARAAAGAGDPNDANSRGQARLRIRP